MKNNFRLSRPELKDGKHLKTPSEIIHKSGDNLPPVFSLHRIDNNFCITKCEKDDKVHFVNKLRHLSQMTWQQIMFSQRHGAGAEKISKDSIKRPIPTGITEEVTFFAIRFSGMKPMIGYREYDIFHIIWIDKDFKVYKH